MCNTVVLSVAGALLACTAWGVDAITARSAVPGTAWVLLRAPERGALRDLLSDDRVRLVQVLPGGHVVQLHLASGAGTRLPRHAVRAVWRLPAGALPWPACA